MNGIKKKILIVDDSELNRAILFDMLSDRFEILEAENGMDAMAILHEHEMEIAIMLLDIVMPVMDGFEVLAMMNKNGLIHSIPVIMISSETGGAYIDRAYTLGAVDYISRPFDERTVKHRVTSNHMLSLRQNEVQQMLSDKVYEKEKDNHLMIEILAHIVEFRNGESGLHVLHVHVITEMLLNKLVEKTDRYDLSPDDIRLISTASALHDIGKIVIPSDVLNKPGLFTPEEYEIMKTHTVEGDRILNNVPGTEGEALIKVSREICRWHHERFDGKGYPDGLKGDEIPIAAQVVALADVYDALTSKRVYKEEYDSSEAIRMIERGECGSFNPILIECLNDIADKLLHELKVISYGRATETNINDTVSNMMKGAGSEVSRRMVKQIEHERMKYKYLADISHEITFEYVVEPEMIKMTDWSAESLNMPATVVDPCNDKQWCEMFDVDDFHRLVAAIKATTPEQSIVIEKFLLNINGESKWYKLIGKAMWVSEDDFKNDTNWSNLMLKNPNSGEKEKLVLEGAICKIMDDNDTTIAINKLQNAVKRDPMTGLFNRMAASEFIQKSLDAREGKQYLFMLMDIDDFKSANDTRGHLFGDSVINEVATRLMANIRSSDIAARIGGDEFVLFMECRDDGESFVKRIFNKLSGKYGDFDIRLSMGVVLVDGGTRTVNDLFNMADAAMYSVKKSSKCGYKFYDDSMATVLLGDRSKK